MINEVKMQSCNLGSKIFIAALVALLVGCATNKSDPFVEVNATKIKASKLNEEDYQPISQLARPSLEPVIQYGANELFNTPVVRKFSAGGGRFSLDFVNIGIDEFASIVFNEMLGQPYTLDSTIKGNVTVQTRGQINQAQLISIVESVLASKAAVLISRDHHYELVPVAKAKSYTFKPELYSARNLKPGYRMVLVPVNYINPEDLKPILDSVAPAAGHLKIDKERRAVIVTGSQKEIENVVDTVQIFDVSWLEAKSIALLPIKNTEATTVKKEIETILTSQSKAHDIVLDTFDRFNALLVVASHKNEIDSVRTWVETLDIQIPSADTQLFVYEVQNRKATDLADILNGIFSGEGATVASGTYETTKKTASKEEVVLTNKKVSTQAPTASDSEGQLNFVADENNNAIIVLARETEYRNIKKVIEDLDKLPLQVLIEVSIVEVTLTDELRYGLEWFLRHEGIQGGDFSSDSNLDLNTGAGIGPIVPGFSFVLNGTGSLVQAVFNTLATESKLDVVSSPSLMALDNQTATIRVGDQQPVQVSSSKSTDNEVLTQSIEYKSTGVLLSVTPRVNSGGLVTMELNQEVTDVGSIDIATGQRSFLQRNINSTVAVQNGSTIILGGLITENTVTSESGIPGLSKIPLVGWMFGNSSTQKVKRELIVLITPKVISNHQYATDVTREYAEKMQLLKSSLEIKN